MFQHVPAYDVSDGIYSLRASFQEFVNLHIYMGMIRDEDARALFESFRTTLQGEVDIVVFTGAADKYGREAKTIGIELAELNPKIHYVHYNVDKDIEEAREYGISVSPSVVIAKHGVIDGWFKFTGLPSGYEFTSVIEAIKVISRNEAALTATIVEKLAKVTNETNIEIYVTPTCPYCPRIVQTAQKFAFLNPHISTEVIESIEFNDRAKQAGVGSVPHVVINGGKQQEFIGGYRMNTLLHKSRRPSKTRRERVVYGGEPYTPLGL